ncbi:DUF624 domain-containing protein [Gracilibacillus caseinilyticus]|uniref:DUF624 domain-containing protein n=1 Tax=Gracilibacillus caseinilyticus TaxID=2932256 RepID=A0ABY4F233_9BACI|nr:DUF624 domain-containing protein [Gracilibacillus caseinilyticus]UOQ50133.1 DUF624 domain-containing protein [Gracilibacillus caseinilyticus]
MNRGMTSYISIGEWLFKILLLNLYWFLFTLAGLVAFGVFPATAALFATIRQDIKEEDDVKLFRTFLHFYKKEFIKSNLLGYIIAIATALLLFNIHVLGLMEASLFKSFMMVMSYILLAIIAIVALFLFPIYAHYQLSLLGYFKYSAILAIGKPIKTVMMLALIAGVCYFYYSIPGFIPALGVSLLAYLIMRIAYPTFAQVVEGA